MRPLLRLLLGLPGILVLSLLLAGIARVVLLSRPAPPDSVSRVTAPPGPASPQVGAVPRLDSSPPSAPAPPRGLQRTVRMPMNVVALEPGRLTALFSGGVHVFPVAREVAVPALARGDTVIASCRSTATGEWVIQDIQRHHGLPIIFGTVKERTASRLVLDSPLGAFSLTVNADSDIAADALPGQYVNAKYYHVGDQRTLLNCRRHPGCWEEDGILLGRSATGFTLRSLRGTVTFRTQVPAAHALAVGAAVTFRYRMDARGHVRPLSLVPCQGGFQLTGKVTAHRPAEHLLNVLDVISTTRGEAHLEYQEAFPVLATLRPGDLVHVTYRLGREGPPRLESIEKRQLRPVFFGTVLSIGEGHVRLVTRQGQVHELRVTRETVMPRPVAPGAMADVIYREDGSGEQTATGIFIE